MEHTTAFAVDEPSAASSAAAADGRRLDGYGVALLILEIGLAIGALGGAWGLMSGAVDASSYVDRVPFSSPSFGGLALAVFVAIPAVLAAVATFVEHRWSATAHYVAGGLLVGWLVAEVLYIGLSSWLQPVMLVWGGAILVLAWLDARRRARRPPPSAAA
jgi:hypothetical protein